MLYKDIWRGPGGGQPRFDASQFLQECYAVCDSPRWALSVGWTTGTASLEPYSQGQVDEAVRSLQQAGQGRATGGGKNSAVTFPVSAYHAYLGRHNMRRLLDADPSYTLTVWGEVPTADCQRWLDEMRPEGRLFLDTKPPGPIAEHIGVAPAEHRAWWTFHAAGMAVAVAVGYLACRVLMRRLPHR